MKQKIVIEERPRGPSIITEIMDSENLSVGVLISRDQIGRLLRGGWSVKRKEPCEASSRKRARSVCFIRRLTDAEIADAILESDESCSKTQRRGGGDVEE